MTSRSRLLVRLAEASELPDAESVWRESVAARDGRPPSPEVIDSVRTVLRDDATQLFVAEREGSILGIACTTPARGEDGAADSWRDPYPDDFRAPGELGPGGSGATSSMM